MQQYGDRMYSEDYIGREQTFIKHTLLRAYLERLFMIIGQYQESISYVDCFAGPWQEGRDDLRDTSIAISLNIMKKCQEGLSQFGKNVQFHALYIEKDKESFGKLESFLAKNEWDEVNTKALPGKFHELRDDILKWCGGGNFTFFFVDHTGWRKAIEIPTLRPLLLRQNSEYLINFMFDFVLRAHTQTQFEEQMKEIFGEVLNTTGMTPKEKEVFFMKQYRKRLKSTQPSATRKPRSAYVKVLYH